MESRRPFSLALVWLGLGVVLFAVGAKLALIHRYGTDQPYADQWAAEGMYFLRGPLYYKVDLTQVTATHGEHRPGLTRLWVLGLDRANGGQWDPFVELVANLFIYAAFLVVAWRLVAALTAGRWLIGVAVVMAAMFALPCAYENFLWGFQSCFLFMLLTGALHVTLTMQTTRVTWRWWVGQLGGFIGLFSIAAGAMSAAALVVLAGLELLRGRRNTWIWATLAANAILLGLGLWLLPETVAPAGGRLARQWLTASGMGYLLSWPYAGLWWCLLLQAPWLLLLLGLWRSDDGEHAAGDWKIVGLALWVTAIVFAIAYGRSVNAENIGVRYYDVLLLGLLVNALALARIVSRQAPRLRWWWIGAAVAWLSVVVTGLWQHNKPDDLGNLFKFQHDQAMEQREIIRDFLKTSDPVRLQAFEQATRRFPHFQTTLDFLRDPKVPALLPPSLTPDGHAGPLSRLAVRMAGGWWFLLGAGLVFLGLGSFQVVRETPRGGHT